MFVVGQKANAETSAGGNCSVLESLKEDVGIFFM